MQKKTVIIIAAIISCLASSLSPAQAQGTAFTYQGRISQNGVNASGNWDITFALFDAASGGNQIGSVLTNTAVPVNNGVFTVTLNFGANFSGAGRWLQIAAQTNGANNFAIVTPRQALTAVPYALYAANAGAAASATTATNAGTAVNFTGVLTGDVSGTQGATVVASVGGQLTTNVVKGVLAANGATNLNVPSTIVSRDVSGNFSAGTITVNGLNVSGTITGNGGSVTNLNGSTVTSGTVADARLSSNVALRGSANTFTGNQVISSGNLGVSTTTPSSLISLGAGNANDKLALWDGGSTTNTLGLGIGPSQFRLHLNGAGNRFSFLDTPAGANELMTISGTGNVGIGVITPTNKLQVAGMITATALQINGTATATAFSGNGSGLTSVSAASAVSAQNAATLSTGAAIGSGSGNSIGNNTVNAFIGGGNANTIGVSSAYSIILGGATNAIGDNVFACNILGGYNNTISNSAFSSTILGGDHNTIAGGVYSSVIAGRYGHANHNNCFVWGDGGDVSTTASAQFVVRAHNGVYFYSGNSGTTPGVALYYNTTAWSTLSDRNQKKNFQPVDGQAILEKLAAIPIMQWNYKWEKDSDTPNIGPVAQDFKPAFYPGRDDKSITTLEFDGVELAAIQGLNEKLEAESKAKDAKIQALEQSMEELKATVQAMAQAMAEKK